MLRTLVFALGLMATTAQRGEKPSSGLSERGETGSKGEPMMMKDEAHAMEVDDEHLNWEDMRANVSLMGVDDYFDTFERNFTQARKSFSCRTDYDCSPSKGRSDRRFLDGREGGREDGREDSRDRGDDGKRGEGRDDWGEDDRYDDERGEHDEEEDAVCGYLEREAFDEFEGEEHLEEEDIAESVCMPRHFCDEEFRGFTSHYRSHCGGMNIARAKMGSVMFFLVIILILIIIALSIGIVYLKLKQNKTVASEQIPEGQELGNSALGQPVHLNEEQEVSATPVKGIGHAVPNTSDKLTKLNEIE